VDLESESVREYLSLVTLQDAIARYLGRELGEITLERREIELEKKWWKLSQTKEFHWTRNLQEGPLTCKNTIFNFVATYNDYERKFARFLDSAGDVLRFASLGTTEQGTSSSLFHIPFLKPSGALGRYFPDWLAVQKQGKREVYWVLETKGRVWEDTVLKDEAARDWCRRISARTKQDWDYERINQARFPEFQIETLAELIGEVRSAETEQLPLDYIFGETETRWLASHPELLKQYAGQWLAMYGEKIITAGSKLDQVLQAAMNKGIARPFTTFIPENPRDEMLGMSNERIS